MCAKGGAGAGNSHQITQRGGNCAARRVRRARVRDVHSTRSLFYFAPFLGASPKSFTPPFTLFLLNFLRFSIAGYAVYRLRTYAGTLERVAS